MIGKGKSITHARASIEYGWNQEKGAEIVHSQFVSGQNPKEISEEFKMVQEQNARCQKNTLSFILSPTIEDGKSLSKEQLKELTERFIKEMKLQERQAIAFVHRDKQHTHVHLYVNRIGFEGKAYNDSFIGKQSQYAAERVAKQMGLTTVREVQQDKLNEIKNVRQQIKDIHEKVMAKSKPRDFDRYIERMKQNHVNVIPSINKAGKLQGFRFEYKGHNLKGSEVHRSMSGAKLAVGISNNTGKGFLLKQGTAVNLLGKVTDLSANIALKVAKRFIKQTIKKGIGFEIGY
ncbi:relaxase/mobilization nuclease domain-containing protein [Pricia sp.]|uniref:relaxase/mobilization nuclease domain-containing protein n=1 Tax=Pricia sp. TaxID=2268138 RepID=UPI0035947D27